MASDAELEVDDLLGVYTRVISFTLQTLIEQAIAILGQFLNAEGKVLSDAVAKFPEHLRFGVPTAAARVLAAGGLRHRRAAIELGESVGLGATMTLDRKILLGTSRDMLREQPDAWRLRLGSLVYQNTLRDLSSITALK